MNDLSQYLKGEPTPRPGADERETKRIEYIMPLELDDREPLGNRYKEVLADPARRSMNYARKCALPGSQVTREECRKADLLAHLHRQYAEESPEDLKRGLPGPDTNAFVNFPIECQTCILHRYAPWSKENAKDAPRPTVGRTIWGLAFGAIGLFWTIGIGKDVGLDPLLTMFAGAGIGIAAFLVVGGIPRLQRRSPVTAHAHGPEEVESSARGVLRPRVQEAPTGHGSIRYREVADDPSPPATPAGASTPLAAPLSPAAANVTGGNTTTPVPEPTPPVKAVTGPDMKDANPAAKAPGPVKPAPVEVSEAQILEKTPKAPRQTPKPKAKPKAAKKADPPVNAAPMVQEPPKVEGFPCDHPGCGKICKTASALMSHKRTHQPRPVTDKGTK